MRRSVFKIQPPCTFLYKLLSVYIFQPRLNAAHFFKILHSGLGNYEAGVSVQALFTMTSYDSNHSDELRISSPQVRIIELIADLSGIPRSKIIFVAYTFDGQSPRYSILSANSLLILMSNITSIPGEFL